MPLFEAIPKAGVYSNIDLQSLEVISCVEGHFVAPSALRSAAGAARSADHAALGVRPHEGGLPHSQIAENDDLQKEFLFQIIQVYAMYPRAGRARRRAILLVLIPRRWRLPLRTLGHF